MSATCENQDFSEIFTHAFNSENAESLMPIQVFNPYDARTAVEFRLTNTGTEPLNVTLYARAINTTDISDGDADIQDTTPQDSTSFDSEMLDTMVLEDTAQDTPDNVPDTGAAACITSDDCVGSSSGNICLPGNVCGCDTSDNCVRVDSGNLCLNAVCTTCVDD
ncbi:MAG: hypothetical protein AAFS10_00475, partial [Myxococcota bacterium]